MKIATRKILFFNYETFDEKGREIWYSYQRIYEFKIPLPNKIRWEYFPIPDFFSKRPYFDKVLGHVSLRRWVDNKDKVQIFVPWYCKKANRVSLDKDRIGRLAYYLSGYAS